MLKDFKMQPEFGSYDELALERLLDDLEEAEIDRQFAAMADNHSYRSLNLAMDREFAESDWEALAQAKERGEA